MSLDGLCALYKNSNQAGALQLYGLGHTNRYFSVDRDTLASGGLLNAISSARVYGCEFADVALVLFRRLANVREVGDFAGDYAQFMNTSNSDPFAANVPTGWNDRTHSALLIATRPASEVRVSFRSAFLEQWRETIDAELSDGAKRNGDPLLTWEMFPESVSYLSNSRAYLKIHQPLDIVLRHWHDYRASLTYHVRLYVNAAGKLRAQGARLAAWVESGVKSDDIAERLFPAVEAGLDTLVTKLNERLALLDILTFRDVYLLPGNQSSPLSTGITTGTTFDDVTIVAERT